MKILVLSSHTPSLFHFRMDMMKAMKKDNNTVIAAAQMSADEWKEEFNKNGIEYEQIFVKRNGINPLSDIHTFISIYKLVKKVKPDRIFVYQAKTVIYGSIAAAMLGIKDIYPLIAGIGSVFLGHGIKNSIIKSILKIQYRVALKKSKNVFFQNEDDKKLFVDSGMVDASKVRLIHGSGVNLEHFKVCELPEQKTILFIGRLVRDKGIYEYLETCKELKRRHPDIRCMLVGPFDTNPSAIEPKMLQEYIDNNIVEYFGEQKDVRKYIVQCTVYVLTSYREGTPKSVLEAMAMGRPIITTNAVGCRETVRNGYNGFLVNVKDIEDTVNKTENLLYSTVLDEFGKNSRRMCEELFDVNKVNDNILTTMEI